MTCDAVQRQIELFGVTTLPWHVGQSQCGPNFSACDLYEVGDVFGHLARVARTIVNACYHGERGASHAFCAEPSRRHGHHRPIVQTPGLQ